MRAVKLCTNKILQFLKHRRWRLMQAGLYNGHKTWLKLRIRLELVFHVKYTDQEVKRESFRRQDQRAEQSSHSIYCTNTRS